MAEDISNQTKSGSKYAIDFLKEGKVEFTLTLGEKNDKYGELTEVSFHKEIYQPGCVEFKVQVGTKTQGSCKGSVDLKYGVDIVAKNYYIFEKVTKGEYVTYKAYSADKFLTIDKFNMAHKGKRLVTPLSINKDPKTGGIVYTIFGLQEGAKTTKSIDNFKSLIDKSVGVPWTKKLNHIGGFTDDTIEAVIPYCVQYNESFLDFMVRICNRYGEFLYCEENKWHIGLEPTTNVIDISNSSASSAAKYESCIKEFQDEAAFLNPNYLDSACVDNKEYTLTEDSAIFKKSNGAFSQEYFQPIDYKDYAKLSDYVPPLSTAFDLLKSAEERQNFFDAVVGTSVAASLRLGIAGKFQHDVNTKYKTKYYEVLKDNSVKDGSNIKYEFTRDSNQVDAGFCKKILKGEEEAERNKLELEYSTYTHLLLGQKVIYDGKNYVVYCVEAGKEKDKEEYQIVVLVPEVNKEFYPLPMKQLHVRKASPQRAVVVNNFDPERLGRVQVKYPWQTKTEPLAADATPWLRVCYPMASNESGFMFFPKTGDEVLIDYEEGNIERPFVAGSFYSKTNSPSVPSSTQMVGAVKSITSDNGHHISFTDLSGGYKFISDIIPLPLIGLLSKFGLLSSPRFDDEEEDKERPAMKMTEWGKDLRKYLAGGFEIADYLGVYSIKGSTHGRNITISSPVGNVVVDAFTGITINAPHGDVNIVGKNVNIEARNNLTIQSGTNIKRPYFWHNSREGAFGILGGLAAVGTTSLMGLIGLDLSFHRTWLEVLLRPIGGTMQIKSYRFMHLEAGAGEVKYNKNVSTINSDNKFFTGMIRRNSFYDSPLYSVENVKKMVADFNTGFYEYTMLRETITSLTRAINDFFESMDIVEVIDDEGNLEEGVKQVNEDDFYSNVKKIIELVEGKTVDGLHDSFGGISNNCLSIYEKKNVVKSNLEKLDSALWNTINDAVDKRMSDIVKQLNDIKYENEVTTWKVGVPDLTFDAGTMKEALFILIKKYVDVSEFKGKILMDKTALEGAWGNENDEKWNEAIKVVESSHPRLKEIASNLNKVLGTPMKNAASRKFGFDGFVDNYVWGKSHKGRIMFSDEKGKTYYLREDGVKAELQEDSVTNLVDVIKKEIKSYTPQDVTEFRNAQNERYRRE